MFDGCAWHMVPFQQPSPVTLPVALKLKSLGIILDRRLTFDNHASVVVKACNYHARAIKHVRHLLPESVAQTLACSLINSRLDYCNSLLYGAPASTINKLQRTQNNAARVVLAAKRHSDAKPLLRQLHWLPVRQHIQYKVAVLTRKVHMTGAPSYLYLVQHVATRQPRSTALPLLTIPRTNTKFARRSYSYSAPSSGTVYPATSYTAIRNISRNI